MILLFFQYLANFENYLVHTNSNRILKQAKKVEINQNTNNISQKF
jgi:hypothetical protein